MPPIMFAIETSQSRSLPLSAQRIVNCFTEHQPQESKSPVPLFLAPGLSAFAATNSGPIRGFCIMQGLLYALAGPTLYQVSSLGVGTPLGTGVSGSNLVGMACNGNQICIVNGVTGWIYDLTSNNSTGIQGWQQITSSAFNPANTVTFFDGYFVFDDVGTNEFFLSALYDGTSYNGLDFASAEASPGFVVGTWQNLQLLFIFCADHIELWYDAGNANFPFARYTGGVINYGCVSPATIIGQDGAIFFLGADKVFYRLQSNYPIRVSTHPVEHIIQEDPDITQATCCTYVIEGHKFVVLNLPASARTLVYDISTQKWHERESWNSANVTLGRWRGNVAIAAYGSVYVGDAFNGNISLLDWTTFTEQGNTMRALAFSAPLHQDRKRIFLSRFELDVQAGVGLSSGQGSNPQIMLSWSKDGGVTFGKLQPWRSMGAQGKYLTRLRWLRMGQARQFVFQISITDPVQRVIIAAHADISVGM
jgi:Phage stabilisation protein